MNNNIFALDKHKRRGLLPFEWIMMGYVVFTLVWILMGWTEIENHSALLWGRARIVIMTLALWGAYSIYPSRALRIARVLLQLSLLSWWYPDTYYLNRILPNLDHLFASIEQSIFGCHPALLFSRHISNDLFSELMYMGYASYFPMIVVTMFYFILFKRDSMTRAATVLLGAFFIYYTVFILLPVVGPQYYYLAVGEDSIAQGIFPNIGNYFLTHSERMTSPGLADGFFYGLVERAHEAGERPTAAFPSSHVGITTILLLLLWNAKAKKLFYSLLPFGIIMFFSTIYIRAHYAIDSLAGVVSGVVLYFLLMILTRKYSKIHH